MEIIRIDSVATAFIRPVEGVNAVLVHTLNGMIMLDTTSSPAEVRGLLEAVGAQVEEVRLVVNTHSHSDHTWGNQVFRCPILAHRLCLERMQTALKKEWSPKTLAEYLTDLEKTDVKKAEGVREMLKDLQFTPPNKVFEDRFAGELGGLHYEVIHLGGHTPDLAVVWLPEQRILYASDLIFQGRYPYIFDGDIPAWIDRLDRLMEFGATTIIPGHGVVCGEAEINTLRDYLQGTWERTAEHIRLGHRIGEVTADREYPIFPGEKYERLHKANIEYMYKQQLRHRG